MASDSQESSEFFRGNPPAGKALDRLRLQILGEVMLIRHGRTEMNEHLAQPGKEWGAPGFVDPGLLGE